MAEAAYSLTNSSENMVHELGPIVLLLVRVKCMVPYPVPHPYCGYMWGALREILVNGTPLHDDRLFGSAPRSETTSLARTRMLQKRHRYELLARRVLSLQINPKP